jgi:hypothetical protein
MGGCVYNDLPIVGWIGINLLVASHSSIKANFTSGGASFANGFSLNQEAVCE